MSRFSSAASSSGDPIRAAQEAALKAAEEIATQAQFASLDAASPHSLQEAAKRFSAILHYAERAIRVLDQAAIRDSEAVQ